MITLHQRAIDLWIHFKRNDPDGNPASGIIFALTDSAPPASVSKPSNTVELCAALNHIKGLPALRPEEKTEIQMYGVVAYQQAQGGFSAIRFAAVIVWANRLGYALGVIALISQGFSWWILSVLIGTWWAYGATRMCAQKHSQDPGPAWELPACIAIHLACLIGLYGLSVTRIIGASS
jgi:hypothetical protein